MPNPFSRLPMRLLYYLTVTLVISVVSLGSAAAKDTANVFRLMVLGDSLTDPNWPGITRADAFPRNIAIALRGLGYNVAMIPLSRSGDEAYGGFLRLRKWLAADNVPPDGVIIELGTNDAIRQKQLNYTENDLNMILNIFANLDVEVLLAGAYGTYPSLGRGFPEQSQIDAFEVMYPRLAANYGTLLYPFFLAGVLDEPATYTSDNLHPNAAGIDLIVARMLPEAEALLIKAGAVRVRGQAAAKRRTP